MAVLATGALNAQNLTELTLRGRPLIPAPRSVRLAAADVVVDETWRLDTAGLTTNDAAVRSLRQDLAVFHSLTLRGTEHSKTVRMRIAPGTVRTRAAAGIDGQAYQLRVAANEIEIAGNAAAGLFYGVQTFVQLLKRDGAGRLTAPAGTIEDWPEYELRFLHWDTKHHQDRIETLKRYLDWAARFKANMIGFELEDRFEYPSHPVIGAPGAYTSPQLQEIVDYGLEHHIQVVPVVQAPAHMAYVLKHPEFAALRADGNNYQIAMCDPRSYPLIFSMYDDVIAATRGVDYFLVSTDEVYYPGIDCAKPYSPEGRSLQWVDFVQKAEQHLRERGRKMLIWAEYPLLAQHASLLPRNIIDGVANPEYLESEKRLGIRQLAYNSMQGEELLFPGYVGWNGPRGVERGRLADARHSILTGSHRRGDPIGVFGAAWDDSGLHCETFWLGWSAIASWGWNPDGTSAEEHVAAFTRAFYGSQVTGMAAIIRMLQHQARMWETSWDRVPSRVRGPAYGDSEGKGIGGQRHDLTIAPPGLPALPDLKVELFFRDKYRSLLDQAGGLALENEALVHALAENAGRAERNSYNLEVLLALARFIGPQWRLLPALASAEASFDSAAAAGRRGDAKAALRALTAARQRVETVHAECQTRFRELQAVFEKSRFPKGREAGGRSFVHVLDDTKDHWADRRADLTYMSAPEESIGLEAWLSDLRRLTGSFARANRIAPEDE